MRITLLPRRIAALLLALCLCVFSSCSAIRKIAEAYKDYDRIAMIGADYVYNTDAGDDGCDESIFTIVDQRFEMMDEIVADGSSLRLFAFEKLFSDQWNDISYIADTATMRFVRYSLDKSNQKANDAYKELNEKYLEIYYRFLQYYTAVYNSPFSEAFYSGWEKDEIDRALKIADMASDGMLELQKKVDALEMEYRALDRDSDLFLKKSASLYAKIVDLNRQIAQKAGFENYADYAYEYIYARDFSPADAEKCGAFSKEYIVPLAEELIDALRSYEDVKKLSEECEAIRRDETSPDAANEELSAYYALLGEESLSAYQNWRGHSYFSNGGDSLSSAYTAYLYYYGHPVCFFGQDTNALLTYVHEQGHYNAFARSGTSASSLDLCELQSQGNEWLFLSQKYENTDRTYAGYAARYILFDDLITILLSVCCDAFEQYVYAHPEMSQDEYDGAFITVSKDLGAYDFLSEYISVPPEQYWHHAIVDNSFYYLSYAVSGIPAIELYVIAQTEGFDRAAEIYLACCKTEQDAAFESTLLSSGLDSPFKESAYQRISDYFSADIA